MPRAILTVQCHSPYNHAPRSLLYPVCYMIHAPADMHRLRFEDPGISQVSRLSEIDVSDMGKREGETMVRSAGGKAESSRRFRFTLTLAGCSAEKSTQPLPPSRCSRPGIDEDAANDAGRSAIPVFLGPFANAWMNKLRQDLYQDVSPCLSRGRTGQD